MITKVIIQNYQSHKHTELEFIPGTNVIIGESDAGKSTIFRALNWVISNRPLGDSFRSEWGGDTSVTIHTSEGNIIERKKTATSNEYIINGKVLKAFGHDAPEEVLDIIQMDSCNIQSQREIPFLLASTPGEAARLLNKAANIDVIDVAVSGIKQIYTQLDKSVKNLKNQLKEKEEDIQVFDDIPELETFLTRIEKTEEKHYAESRALGLFEAIIYRGRTLEEALKNTKSVPQAAKKVKDMESVFGTYKEGAVEVKGLEKLVSKGIKIKDILSHSEQVEKAGELESTTSQALLKYNEKKKTSIILSKRIKSASGLVEALGEAEKRLKGAEAQYQEIAPEECPLCGKEM